MSAKYTIEGPAENRRGKSVWTANVLDAQGNLAYVVFGKNETEALAEAKLVAAAADMHTLLCSIDRNGEVTASDDVAINYLLKSLE